MAPVLYKLDASPPANAVRMLADIIGLELELKDVKMLEMEHKSPEYLKINPIGSVPLLKDGDFVLSDSHAIMKYLLSKYGGDKVKSLYPSDLQTQALMDQAMFFNTGVYFIKLKNVTVYLQNGKYIAADHMTIAEIALGSTTGGMQTIHKLDKNKYQLTANWLSRMEQEPFFKKIVLPAAEMLVNLLHTVWEINKQKKS